NLFTDTFGSVSSRDDVHDGFIHREDPGVGATVGAIGPVARAAQHRQSAEQTVGRQTTQQVIRGEAVEQTVGGQAAEQVVGRQCAVQTTGPVGTIGAIGTIGPVSAVRAVGAIRAIGSVGAIGAIGAVGAVRATARLVGDYELEGSDLGVIGGVTEGHGHRVLALLRGENHRACGGVS